ncbi:hypothetical protein ACWEIJ_20105 [Lentzea sp. NPDC004789]
MQRIHTDRGIGLGLSIVDAVVAAHRGELVISARAAGGLDVAVHLPVEQWGGRPAVGQSHPVSYLGDSGHFSLDR